MCRPLGAVREFQPVVRWKANDQVWSVYSVLPSTTKSTFQMWRRHLRAASMPDHQSTFPCTVAPGATKGLAGTERRRDTAGGGESCSVIACTKCGSTGWRTYQRTSRM